jgi:pyruvate formate lyase activating enzyme
MSIKWSEHACKYNLQNEWNDTLKEAYLYDRLSTEHKVRCRLCPRNCVIQQGEVGFCKVRKNINGTLYAQTYEKAAHVAIEKIETEAIFHYEPGADILSLGTIGCNLNCSYCQNWSLSQAEYANPNIISQRTSEQIVNMALKNNIKILSWTYSEPAVWFEFVIDTARLARKHGLVSLFKSAYFLSEEATDMIIDAADLFAVSLKAMDNKYYQTHTQGWIAPVLNCTKKIHRSGKPLEIENLIVTGLTDKDSEYIKIIDFVKKELDESVPLHFSSFHPDYKYVHLPQADSSHLERARAMALERGLQYVYVGNVFENVGLHSYCSQCGTMLVERFGLNSRVLETLDRSGRCVKCGKNNNIKLKP